MQSMNILEHSNTLVYKEILCDPFNLIQKIPHRHIQMFVSKVMVDSVNSQYNPAESVVASVCPYTDTEKTHSQLGS